MLEKIKDLAELFENETIKTRRDFHKYAETAWTEYRTASIVADKLCELGYEVYVGDKVIAEDAMMGLPGQTELDKHEKRAIEQGANPNWIAKMAGGKTGIVGIMDFAKPGPIVALRFDMDANDAEESNEGNHRPFIEGFASVNKGAMHACGHDGHTAIGLTTAKIISMLKDDMCGKIKFIFQPGEEGVRGAKAMTTKGVVDDVDYFMAMHIGTTLKKLGQVTYNAGGFLATSKLDANFIGHPAHAGIAPETGKNALLAAATAVLNLQAIPRHSQGASRINVGFMQGGTGRNVIPANATLKLETRGVTGEINEYMYQEARRIIEGAAAMYGVEVNISEMGSATSCESNKELGEKGKEVAAKMNLFHEIIEGGSLGGSEDATYFMERVQQKGGKAVYAIIGTEIAAGHHDFRFDFNEEVLAKAVAFVTGVSAELLKTK